MAQGLFSCKILIHNSLSLEVDSAITIKILNTALLIRASIEDNSRMIFLFLIENICCDPSLELSRRDGSNDGSQHYALKE